MRVTDRMVAAFKFAVIIQCSLFMLAIAILLPLALTGWVGDIACNFATGDYAMVFVSTLALLFFLYSLAASTTIIILLLKETIRDSN